MCERSGFGWALKKVCVVPLRFNYGVATYYYFFLTKNKKNELNLNFIECIKFTISREFTSLWSYLQST